MITIVGVGHVFDISEAVRRIIVERRPQAVCIELDPLRYRALMDRKRSARVPLQYRLLAYLQDRLAEQFGTEVGDEMLAAVSAAEEVGAQVALIDMDAGAVFKKLWSSMPLREKFRMLTSAVLSLFLTKERVEEEIEQYEGHEDEYIQALGREMPTLKAVLIDDRNGHMATALKDLSSKHPRIVAVVGDGHVPGLLQNLAPLETEAIRLKDIRSMAKQPASASEHSTSFWYQGT
jgi:pheromone shutdown protein TraB